MEETVLSSQDALPAVSNCYGVKMIGIGGAGCSVLKKMADQAYTGLHLIPCHTDFTQLVTFPQAIPLGMRDLGLGLTAEQARQWALDQQAVISSVLNPETKIVILVGGLGDGTVAGAAPVIAEMARQRGVLVVACVMMPFASEGYETMQMAERGLKQLTQSCDSVVAFSLDKLAENLNDDLSIAEFYAAADELLCQTARIVPDILKPSETPDSDIQELKTVLEGSGLAFYTQLSIQGSQQRLEASVAKIKQTFGNQRTLPHEAQRILLVVQYDPLQALSTHEIRNIIQALKQTLGRRAAVFKVAPLASEGLGSELRLGILSSSGRTPEVLEWASTY
ncbi:hypothetical protein [Siphonobacter sp.]|uniref:hypothetical protein n=1 Tax=Siphonobacter sp. TaxID=1869184 RepID=UPI003B3A1083